MSSIFRVHNFPVPEKVVNELLEMNQKTQAFGLTLTPAQIQQMITARNKVLRDYGRVELGFEVTKQLMELFCASPYINKENYATALHELHEIFYYLRNETEDKIGDAKLIDLMKDYFDNECAGSLELLKSTLEEFAEQFRRGALHSESLFGEDDEFGL